MRPSNKVACARSPHVVEQEHMFNWELAGANEMQRVIWKFTLGISQRKPSHMKVG